jgi:hypothetical protein
VASSHKRSQIISSLDIDHQSCSNTKLLESHIFLFFKSLMGSRALPKDSLSLDLWSE